MDMMNEEDDIQGKAHTWMKLQNYIHIILVHDYTWWTCKAEKAIKAEMYFNYGEQVTQVGLKKIATSNIWYPPGKWDVT